jgi:S-formylglutathione hydrolase FrmB
MKLPVTSWMHETTAALVTVASLVAMLAPAPPAGAAPPPLPAPNSHGIALQGWSPVDPTEPSTVARLFDATMLTTAIYEPGDEPTIDPVAVPVKVRIYLPAGYQTDPLLPYPVLYLLHGGFDGFSSWSEGDRGDIKTVLESVLGGVTDFPGIVVMPEGGPAGWYADWYGRTNGDFAPSWETFHTEQLVPWIDDNLNTIDSRSGRAIAGVSMGGLGALAYSGRHPLLFSGVGAFSALTDLTEPKVQMIVGLSMWFFGAVTSEVGGIENEDYQVSGSEAHRMKTVFGPTSGWATRNPLQMAQVYGQHETKFGLYAGQNTSPSDGEGDVGAWNDEFHHALNTNGVTHRYCSGTGSHSWEFWQQDLRDFINYVYGTAPDSCPNGWGAPRP